MAPYKCCESSSSFVNQLTRTIQGKLLNDLKESICQEVLDSLEFNSANQGDVMAAMRKEIDELKEVNDDSEQYSRRTCLVISGVPERMNENTDSRIIQLCKEDLGVDIKMDDVERSHRLGQQKPQSDGSTTPRIGTTSNSHPPRNIIVKFSSYRTREQVYSARFKLKNLSDENNHHVYINESLTKKRKELLWKVRNKFKKIIDKTWTQDGRICIKLKEGKGRVNVTRERDLDKLSVYMRNSAI